MKFHLLILFCMVLHGILTAQITPGFFLDDWTPKYITSPLFNDMPATNQPASVKVHIDATDIVTKIARYYFGNNATCWTGQMISDSKLMENMANLNLNVIRGPGGGVSDVYFWDLIKGQRPPDIPQYLPGKSDTFNPWAGKNNDSWTMSLDSFYKILARTNSTGILTVNYGYARYGTSKNPVARAAEYAANWVRFDNGRSKFWEIGNENMGDWEAGYRIDTKINQDGQPEYINGEIYGQHCRTFIEKMKAAARENSKDIKIGVAIVERKGADHNDWNHKVFTQVGDLTDYYIFHSYFTPWNQNSTVQTILSSYKSPFDFVQYVKTGLERAGRPLRPIALTEWNISAVGSKQMVSYIAGVHAALTLGQIIESNIGLACRWDLANGWNNGDDHGLFSYGSEPDVPVYHPRPAFYYLYYFQKFLGDRMVRSTVTGSEDIVVYASTFTSKQVGVILINMGKTSKTVKLQIDNFKCGERYYTYLLTGGRDNQNFSRKVFVNGTGPAYDAGGPDNYASIPANSTECGNEIKLSVPSLGVLFVLIESSQDAVPEVAKEMLIYPNPAKNSISFLNKNLKYTRIKVYDVLGRTVLIKKQNSDESLITTINFNWPAGSYFLELSGGEKVITRKFMVVR